MPLRDHTAARLPRDGRTETTRLFNPHRGRPAGPPLCIPGNRRKNDRLLREAIEYCRSSIVSGQRWVRKKIYDPTLNGRDPSYHYYHAEPFAAPEGSCWEKKHEMERAAYAA